MKKTNKQKLIEVEAALDGKHIYEVYTDDNTFVITADRFTRDHECAYNFISGNEGVAWFPKTSVYAIIRKS